MEENDIYEKLKQMHKKSTIDLKNMNADKNVHVIDVEFIGRFNLNRNDIVQEREVFLVTSEVNGQIEYQYYTEEEILAIRKGDYVIPKIEYQKTDFIKIENDREKNKVSLNSLEQKNNDDKADKRIDAYAYTIGMRNEDIEQLSEIDVKKEEENLAKNLNIKDKFSPTDKITKSDSFASLIPGAGKYRTIAVIVPKNSNNKFEFVGITNDGRFEKIDDLVQIEGTSPNESINSSNRTGSSVNKDKVSSMFARKGDYGKGFAIDVEASGIEVNYFVRDSHDDYTITPIESTKTRSVYATPREITDRRRYNNSELIGVNKKANQELSEHSESVPANNIDKTPANDIGHDDIIRTNSGEEKTKEEALDQIEKEQKVSRKEAERLYDKNKDPGETYEKVLSDVEEEVQSQMPGHP